MITRDLLGRWPKRRASVLSPSGLEKIVFVVLALTVGGFLYAQLVAGTYRRLSHRYATANVAGAILAPDPEIPPAPPDQNLLVKQDKARLFRCLQALKIVRDNDSIDKVNDTPAGAIFDAFYPGDRMSVKFSTAPTTKAFAWVALNIPWSNGNGQVNDPEYLDKLSRLLAALLANQPGASDEFRRIMADQVDVENPPAKRLGPDGLLDHLGENLSTWRGFVFSSEGLPVFYWPAKLNSREPRADELSTGPMSNTEIISAFYRIAGVTSVASWPDRPDGAAKPTSKVDPAMQRAMSQFLEGLLEWLRADYAVKEEAKNIPMFQGYEQFAMAFVFMWTLLFFGGRAIRLRKAAAEKEMLLRGIEEFVNSPDFFKAKARAGFLRTFQNRYQKKNLADPAQLNEAYGLAPRIAAICGNLLQQHLSASERAIEPFRRYCRATRQREVESRWFLKYLAFALPAIGFIGTKRGIAEALSQADIIVRAQDQGAQAIAISTVTSTLGIAFTTTLIALLMGLLTTLINLAQSHAESAMITEIEEALLPLLETAVARTPDPASIERPFVVSR